MSGNDNHTYGFSKADADELVEMIGGGETEHFEGRVRGGVGLKIFGFTLTQPIDRSGGSVYGFPAAANIHRLTPGFQFLNPAFATGQAVQDPSGASIGMEAGQTGLCVRQHGFYFAITPVVRRTVLIKTPSGGLGPTPMAGNCEIHIPQAGNYPTGTGEMITAVNTSETRTIKGNTFVTAHRDPQISTSVWFVSFPELA